MSGRVNYFGKTFAQWLLEERRIAGQVSSLATIARSDPAFPRNGDIDQVRSRLSAINVDSHIIDSLPIAERLWLRS